MRKVLILLLYRILPAAAFPLLLLYVFLRCLRDPRYFRRLSERFGFLPASFDRTAAGAVWLHAVSVGEVLSSIPLIGRIREALPASAVFLSCSTLAGREVADARLSGLVDGIFFAPIDYVSTVRRVLRRIRPAVVVVLETEIWPNLYREVKKAGCGLVVVNGRISPKALPRYRRLAWFFRTVLALPDAILVQSEADRERYLKAGAPPERVHAAGNLKYDFSPASVVVPAGIQDWLNASRGPLWVAASTVAPEYEGDVDEDDCVIDAWKSLTAEFPGLRMVIAPRKPERFDIVAAKLASSGVPFARRSQLPADAPVLLLDSLGELVSVFPFATVVFVGGTLADRGGHNILEPASSARAVVVGPHLENFAQIQSDFRAAQAFVEIEGPRALAPAIAALLRDPARRQELGERARAAAESERGATRRAVEAIAAAREEAVPRVVSYGPLKPLLWVLCGLWRAGGALKRATARPRSLRAPVISVGSLTMGGAGKTPVVRWLARELGTSGLEVAVLTRGYRRRSAERVTVVERGGSAPVELTGDEGQTILGDGASHLGISAARYEAGRAIEERFRPDVFLLDDGFQHASLHRDFDLVVLDGLDPFGGGFLFPRGRLREPVSALARAHAILITRAGGRRFTGLHRIIRAANPVAPIFHADFEPARWTESGTGRRLSADAFAGCRVGAFCGIANPESFRRTLAETGCRPVWFQSFGDHHDYRPADGDELARRAVETGVEALLTTEKDAVKLGPLGVPMYSLSLQMRVYPGEGTGPDDLLAIVQNVRKVTKA